MLRQLEDLGLPAVRAAGLVLQPEGYRAMLVTRYLDGSWQYRRLLMRLPPDQPKHRARLFDAMASLLVDLHRNGIYWGDCSLANTLFSRDGQIIQAWLVDAETAEVHPTLSDGQRELDLEIMVENVAAGMLDLAARLDRPPELSDTLIDGSRKTFRPLPAAVGDAARRAGVRLRRPVPRRRARSAGSTTSASPSTRSVPAAGQRRARTSCRLKVAVGDRRFHAEQLRDLTGLDVGEGQARILLGDLRTYQGQLCRESRPRRRRVDGGPAVGHGGRDAGDGSGARRGRATGHSPSRPTATCSRCGGCSASEPATTWAPTGRWRRCPATSYPPTPRPRWPSSRSPPRRCPPSSLTIPRDPWLLGR